MPEQVNAHVLVIDDEESIRRLVAKFLVRQGADVTEARDGAEAIAILGEQRFDAIITDLMMPRVDGFGVLAYLSEHDPAMLKRTVVITAFPRTAQTKIEHPCTILSKPFDLESVADAVRECSGITEARE